MCMYVYIYREREMLHVYVTCMYVCMCIYIYIHIYIYTYITSSITSQLSRRFADETACRPPLQTSWMRRRSDEQQASLRPSRMPISAALKSSIFMGCLAAVLFPYQEGMRNRTEQADSNRTEPNRLISEPAGTGRGTEPNPTGPSHGVSEKRKLNRVEPGKVHFRTEPHRTDESSKSPEPKRIEPNRFLPAL